MMSSGSSSSPSRLLIPLEMEPLVAEEEEPGGGGGGGDRGGGSSSSLVSGGSSSASSPRKRPSSNSRHRDARGGAALSYFCSAEPEEDAEDGHDRRGSSGGDGQHRHDANQKSPRRFPRWGRWRAEALAAAWSRALALCWRACGCCGARLGGRRVQKLLGAVGLLVALALLSSAAETWEMSDAWGGKEKGAAASRPRPAQQQAPSPGERDPRPASASDPPSSWSDPDQHENADPEEDGAGDGFADDVSSASSSSSPGRLPSMMENASALFRDRWCDADGAATGWYPRGPDAWQTRAPYAMIPGARHAGGELVARLVLGRLFPSSVLLARPPTLGQFYPQRFRSVRRPQDKTHVALARAKMYARDYAPIRRQQQEQQEQEGSSESEPSPPLLGLDYTTGYLFYPPTRILCVMPWVRLLVVLRNPVDRVWAHYRDAQSRRGYRGTLEAWLEREWRLLEESGLAAPPPPGRNRTAPWRDNETALDEAWYRYQSKAREGPIGRSLYEPQLSRWLQAVRAVGRNASSDVLVVWVEDLIAGPGAAVDQMAAFLGLAPPPPPGLDAAVLRQFEVDSHLMGRATRRRLESFFRPFDRRLRRLLRAYRVPTTASASSSSGKG